MEQAAVAIETESETSIVHRYDRLIGYLARRFRLDADDLVQVGRVALLEAFRNWPSKPHTSTFWTYARKAVLGEMLNYATGEITRIAMEAESGLLPAPSCPPDAALEVREHIASLSDRKALVLAMYTAGHDVADIAAENAISAPRVYQLIEDSMENIRERA